MDPPTAYYVNQGGGRLDDYIGPMYVGSPYIQQGKGLGSFLAGLFRTVKPALVSGAKSLGRAPLTTSANIMSDIASKQEIDRRWTVIHLQSTFKISIRIRRMVDATANK
jgi:hypothetical protein